MKHLLFSIGEVAPVMLMLIGMLLPLVRSWSTGQLWRMFIGLSSVSLAACLINACVGHQFGAFQLWLSINSFGTVLAFLVQLLCTVIAAFSSRYLDGEPGQQRYITSLSGVVTAVHLLLMADHWIVLIIAWALIGASMQQLLCFYPDRPFALLAAHKKQIADRVADLLLLGAASLAWSEVGSGSLSHLWTYVGINGMSTTLQLSAVGLVLAVIIRTALLPIHGWLIQVMEAPTPVSALLHAGVVNLGGYVLILFSPLLEHAMLARTLLVVFGLGTAVLAGLVMLTRVSIKVRLAWSTTAQMGFMVLECGLGLYTLAALHLIGHSLYKAHTFLSASMTVRQARLQEMRCTAPPIPLSLLLSPLVATTAVLIIQTAFSNIAWPWWWSGILGLAWAPLLWLPAQRSSIRIIFRQELSGLLMVVGLTVIASLAHALPLGIHDAPNNSLGMVALMGMAILHLCLVTLQFRPQLLRVWQRRSYAGFYMDEVYTRLALKLWPTSWSPGHSKPTQLNSYSMTTADITQEQ